MLQTSNTHLLVSYRLGQSALKQAFIEQFTAGVSAELEALRAYCKHLHGKCPEMTKGNGLRTR